MVKRTKLEIIRDILNIIKNSHKIKPTPLLRQSNISSVRFKEYFSELMEKEFVEEIGNKKGISSSLNSIACLYKDIGNYKKAETFFQKEPPAWLCPETWR